MITIYMLKTPHCIKCEMMKPQWEEIKEYIKNKYNNSVEFKEIIAGQDMEAGDFILKHKIKAAPAFIYCNSEEEYLIELDKIIDKINLEMGESKNED